MSKFQIIIIGVLGAAGLVAVLMFMGVIPGFGKGGVGSGNEVKLTMWGPFSSEKVRAAISKINEENSGSFSITYSEKKPETYKNELLNAMASGNPPDIWFLSQDMVLEYKDKVQIIPFESFPERNFRDIFVDSSNLFINRKENGIIALPYIIDPIVLYWNRDLFSSAGIARPPQYWNEFLSSVIALTKFDGANNIIQSGASFGEFDNVKNAKDILSMMILQTGSLLVEPETLNVVWEEKGNAAISPVENAVMFYNDFSNPKKTSYSWNRALKNSNDMFVAGSLAMYFGYASELSSIKEKNPHLNFDVGLVPQIKDGKIKAAFGRIYALAVSKTSHNQQAAFSAMTKLIDKSLNKGFSESLFLAPARRDALTEGSPDPVLSVFYKAGIMARSWLEPNPQKVSDIFEIMIESTATGKMRMSDAVRDATRALEQILK